LVRSAFLFICAFPTLLVLMASTVAHTRRSTAEALEQWKSTIEFQLGLKVDVQSIEPAALGVVLNKVTLRHPETYETIAEIRQLFVAQAAERGWIVECRYPTIDAKQFPHLWSILNDHFSNRRGSLNWCGTLSATNIAWKDDEQLHTLPQLRCEMRHGTDSSQCTVSYCLEDQDPTAPAQLTIVRNRQPTAATPTTSYEWKTSSSPLPLRWLWSWMPELERLGKDAKFIGTVTVDTVEGAGSNGKLVGSLQQVDLAELVSRSFPHHVLQGSSDIEFSCLRWHDNRMTEIDGKLTARQGLVGRSLLEAASHVGLEIPAGVVKLSTYRFGRITLGFHGRDELLHFGDEAQNPGAAIVVGGDSKQTKLLVATDRESDTAALLRWLVPDSQHQIPATEQTGPLTNFLHLPPVRPQGLELYPPAVRLGSPESNDGRPLSPQAPPLTRPLEGGRPSP
jgi:hypothetical protein